MRGVPCRPWVHWLAGQLGLELVNLAVNGAQLREVLSHQLPRAQGSFALACLYVGINDARGIDFDCRAFRAGLSTVAGSLEACSAHLLMVTVPLDLGRPRAGAKVLEANRAIREVAGAHGATVLSNEGRRGWLQVLPDAVHLTAVGQRALAAEAVRALRADGRAPPAGLAGCPTAPDPDELSIDLSAVQALRYALGGHARALWRDLGRRAREGTLW
jgi:GDSL-like lipase/acylhydrolase family protein